MSDKTHIKYPAHNVVQKAASYMIACDNHARDAFNAIADLGIPVTMTHIDKPVECAMCQNEERKNNPDE